MCTMKTKSKCDFFGSRTRISPVAFAAETEARNQAQLEEAEAALQAAREEVRHADERATAAEMAKIQLSMRIADLDDARAAQLSTNEQTLGSPSSPQNTPQLEVRLQPLPTSPDLDSPLLARPIS